MQGLQQLLASSEIVQNTMFEVAAGHFDGAVLKFSSGLMHAFSASFVSEFQEHVLGRYTIQLSSLFCYVTRYEALRY